MEGVTILMSEEKKQKLQQLKLDHAKKGERFGVSQVGAELFNLFLEDKNLRERVIGLIKSRGYKK